MAELLLAMVILLGVLTSISSAVPPLLRSWRDMVLLESQLRDADNTLSKALSGGGITLDLLVEPLGTWGTHLTLPLTGERRIVLVLYAN